MGLGDNFLPAIISLWEYIFYSHRQSGSVTSACQLLLAYWSTYFIATDNGVGLQVLASYY